MVMGETVKVTVLTVVTERVAATPVGVLEWAASERLLTRPFRT